MKRYRLVCKASFETILLQLILWALLFMVTFGLAMPFFIYYFVKMMINKTELHEIEEKSIPPWE